MDASLHNTDSNSAKVRNFAKDNEEGSFATVAVEDADGNQITLFFKNLGEVLNFSLKVQEETRAAIAHAPSNRVIKRVFSN